MFVSTVSLVDVRSRKYMTQASGGASADPDPAWWRWTHALSMWIILPIFLLRFWTREHFSCVAVYGGSESSQIQTKTS